MLKNKPHLTVFSILLLFFIFEGVQTRRFPEILKAEIRGSQITCLRRQMRRTNMVYAHSRSTNALTLSSRKGNNF